MTGTSLKYWCRGFGTSAALALAVAAAQCTNSTTLVDPSPAKCQIKVAPQNASMDANGGSASVNITIDPECAWSVTTATSWITITSPSGQGTGKADFRVAANPAVTSRHGELSVNTQVVQVDQSGCAFTLSETGQAVGTSGGSVSVDVRAGSACTWTATSNADWITLTAGGSGAGPGTVSFTVAPNTGSPRTGSLTIAGQTYTVTQGAGCTYTVNPLNQTVASGSGSASVAVSSPATCAWTASTSTDWIKITSGSTGNGNGSVVFTFTTNPSTASRTGQLTIAGQTATVSQSGTAVDCTASVNPASESIGSGAGAGAPIFVNIAGGCSWAASSNVGWLTITGGSSGTGPGPVTFNAAANAGPPRVGTLTVAGQTVTINQGSGCSFTLSPMTGQTVPGTAGSYIVTIGNASSPSCGWTAAVTTNFPGGGLGVSPGSGTGNASVTFTVTANTGPQRVGTLTIAGQTFTVTQSDGCTFTLTPATGQTVPSTAGSYTVTIGNASNPSCGWTASVTTNFAGGGLSVSPGSGTGNGSVMFTVTANIGPQRVGTLTIAGQTFTVTQSDGCSFSLSPPNGQTVPKTAGPYSVTINATGPSCGWTAAVTTNFPGGGLSVSPGSGTGNGSVTFTVTANTGPQRVGTLTIGGQTFTVTQANGCTFVLSPPAGQTVPKTAGSYPVLITNASNPSCTWTAAVTTNFTGGGLSVSPGSGTGNGSVMFTVTANTGPQRVGTLTIAGISFTVTQLVGP